MAIPVLPQKRFDLFPFANLRCIHANSELAAVSSIGNTSNIFQHCAELFSQGAGNVKHNFSETPPPLKRGRTLIIVVAILTFFLTPAKDTLSTVGIL